MTREGLECPLYSSFKRKAAESRGRTVTQESPDLTRLEAWTLVTRWPRARRLPPLSEGCGGCAGRRPAPSALTAKGWEQHLTIFSDDGGRQALRSYTHPVLLVTVLVDLMLRS